jgi:protein phosphatase
MAWADIGAAPGVLDGAVGQDAKPSEVCHAASEAIQVAREEIRRFAHTHPGYESMGATLTLAVAAEDTMYLVNVGDCRAYRLRGEKLSQLTTDQTFVQSMIKSGQLSKDEAKTHPWRHVVLNAVGVKQMDEPIEISTTPLVEGDRLLLATDGLTDVVDDQTLEKILARRVAPQEVAEELVHRALENDSKDNVSCIVADIVTREPQDGDPS